MILLQPNTKKTRARGEMSRYNYDAQKTGKGFKWMNIMCRLGKWTTGMNSVTTRIDVKTHPNLRVGEHNPSELSARNPELDSNWCGCRIVNVRCLETRIEIEGKGSDDSCEVLELRGRKVEDRPNHVMHTEGPGNKSNPYSYIYIYIYIYIYLYIPPINFRSPLPRQGDFARTLGDV